MKSPKSIYQMKYEYALNRYTEQKQKHQQKGGSHGITKLTTFYKIMDGDDVVVNIIALNSKSIEEYIAEHDLDAISYEKMEFEYDSDGNGAHEVTKMISLTYWYHKTDRYAEENGDYSIVTISVPEDEIDNETIKLEDEYADYEYFYIQPK